MHNLFVVRSPLQLMSAYILADQMHTGEINDLVLINHRGDDLWKSTFCLNRMVNDRAVWHNVISIKHQRIARRADLFRLRARMGALKKQLLEPGKVDQVYLGSDSRFDNQLLVELVGNTSYIRLDDGVWSYSGPTRSRVNRVKMYAWSRLVKLVSGIHSGLKYNYIGGGYGPAATADYLFKPQFLKRPTPGAVPIPQAAIHRSLAKLTEGMEPVAVMQDVEAAMVFLGSVFVDQGQLTLEQELALLKKIAGRANEQGIRLCYKPHPFEKKEKLARYQEQIPELILINFSDPIEIFFYCYPQIKTVLSYSSSALLFADLFSRQGVQAIALFKLFKFEKNEKNLEDMMQAAGVLLPNTADELLEKMI